MTTKPFGLHGLVWSPFGPAIAGKLLLFLTLNASLLLVSGCFTWFRPSGPVLYKPSCDLSPVLRLQFPERIDTLAGVPRTKTVFENGTDALGGRLPDDIKEQFDVTKGATEYMFIVFYSEAAAITQYRWERERHVFRETTENGLVGRVHYTEQPRADPEGGLVPMGEFISRADFRLHNVYIRVVTLAHTMDHEKPQNDKLTNAVKDLAQMLGGAFNAKQ